MILASSFRYLPWQAWVIGGGTAIIFGILAFLAIKLKCITLEPDEEEKDDE